LRHIDDATALLGPDVTEVKWLTSTDRPWREAEGAEQRRESEPLSEGKRKVRYSLRVAAISAFALGSSPEAVFQRIEAKESRIFKNFSAESGKRLRSKLDLIAAYFQLKEIIKGQMIDNMDHCTRNKTQFLPAPQAPRVVILGLANDHTASGRQIAKSLQHAVAERPILRRDQVAVRILGRLAEVLGDGLFQSPGDGVFEGLCLGIYLAPV